MKPSIPDFFVIGAQKCGTTTLYEDLRLHPSVLLAEKESCALRGPDASANELISRYEEIFKRASDGAVLGEISTRYAMLPDDPEIPRNAGIAAPEAKVIYIVREPVSRIISHHHHDFGLGLVGPDIDAALQNYPSLITNTQYASQLEPWLDTFGPDSVRVVRFEDYMSDRVAGSSGLLRFIGVDLDGPFDPGSAVHNAASTKYIAPGRWGRISQSPLYRQGIRRLMPETVRHTVNRVILPKAPPRPAPPSRDSLYSIIQQMRPEVERLARLTGREPLWDLDQSLAHHLSQE